MDTNVNKKQKMNKKLVLGISVVVIIAIIFIPKYVKNKEISGYALELAKESLSEEGYSNFVVEVENISKEQYIDKYSVEIKVVIDENEYDPYFVARNPVNELYHSDDLLVVIEKVNVYNQQNNLLYSEESLSSRRDEEEIEQKDEDLGACWSLAKEAVKSKLKAPSTAEFPFSYGSDGVSITCEGDIYTVKAWVDAENSYGAQIRNNFTVIIEKSGTGENAKFTTVSCVIE